MDRCVHCHREVIEARTLSPFGLMHVHSSSEYCNDGKHLACLTQQGYE